LPPVSSGMDAMNDMPEGLELRSRIDADGVLRISLEAVAVREPGAGELLVRVLAAPINPSDLGLLLGPAKVESLRVEGTGDTRVLAADVPTRTMPAMAARLGASLPVGNEGAGIVVRAAPDLAHLVGRTVAMIGGAMYARYRTIAFSDCLLLPEGVPPRDAASLYVNPLTALGFVETMRRDGHHALIHTAAASNLGRMLLRICEADGIPLVNIVRSAAQVELLRSLGAKHVIDSTAPDFTAALEAAIAETGATLGFDAIGGGSLAGQILNAMEAVAGRASTEYSRYGSDTAKHVYIYGALDTGPTVLDRRFGFSWGIGGWLLFPWMKRAGGEVAARMRQRVIDEHATTFASSYHATIGLADMLDPATVTAFARKATGEKFLLDPSR
jgi:NADPH:quinone reductase-like Zn-dependent oxidoreductase